MTGTLARRESTGSRWELRWTELVDGAPVVRGMSCCTTTPSPAIYHGAPKCVCVELLVAWHAGFVRVPFPGVRPSFGFSIGIGNIRGNDGWDRFLARLRSTCIRPAPRVRGKVESAKKLIVLFMCS